jgi:hypothetical protein
MDQRMKEHRTTEEEMEGPTGAQNIVKEIKQYQQKWLQHVHRMNK